MPRLYRPYISLAVRVQVAERQMREKNADLARSIEYGQQHEPDSRKLRVFLVFIFGGHKVELHHRPALVNRRRYVRNGKVFYDPPANDPAHLIYLADVEHDIETRVRGVGAQRSDLGQLRYNKKVARNRTRIKTSKKDRTHTSDFQPKTRGRNRKLFPPAKASGFPKQAAQIKRGARFGQKIKASNRWPPKGSRKIENRRGRDALPRL